MLLTLSSHISWLDLHSSYTVTEWANDIALASSKGLDALVLNIGIDSWQPARVADAFTAAANAGSTFKIGFSFDMTSLSCSSAGDVTVLQNYINTYSSHPNVLQYNNKILITTFAGESCTFGQGSVDAGWNFALKTGSLPAVYFIPSFFVAPDTFPTYTSTDGQFNVSSQSFMHWKHMLNIWTVEWWMANGQQ